MSKRAKVCNEPSFLTRKRKGRKIRQVNSLFFPSLQDSPSPDHSKGQLVTINENWDSVEDQEQGEEESEAYESDTDGSDTDSDSRLSSRSRSASRDSIKSRSASRSLSPSNSKSDSGSQVGLSLSVLWVWVVIFIDEIFVWFILPGFVLLL